MTVPIAHTVLVSKSTAVDSVTTWVLRLSRDGHIGSSVPYMYGTMGPIQVRRASHDGVTDAARAIMTTLPRVRARTANNEYGLT